MSKFSQFIENIFVGKEEPKNKVITKEIECELCGEIFSKDIEYEWNDILHYWEQTNPRYVNTCDRCDEFRKIISQENKRAWKEERDKILSNVKGGGKNDS